MGYTVVFALLNNKSYTLLADKIDQHLYNDKDLVLVKVPLNLNYYISQGEYEAFEGSATINGNHYNYVKRKVYNDTLFLLCLPNKERDKLQLAKSNYAKGANGFEGKNDKDDMAKVEKSFSPYHEKQNDYLLTHPAVTSNKLFSFIPVFIPRTFITPPYLPPDVSC